MSQSGILQALYATPAWACFFMHFIFRQHAASIYGFVRQLVSFVSSKKNLKCNISLTGAQIFMKFETYVYKIVLDHQPNFHKDPCKDACARGVNARAFHRECTRLQLVRAHICTDLYENLVGG